jgi:hypothetical protein
MTLFLLILLGIYVFKFAAFASVKCSPFEARSTAFLNGMNCRVNNSMEKCHHIKIEVM